MTKLQVYLDIDGTILYEPEESEIARQIPLSYWEEFKAGGE
jgi:hypothetical protein